MNIVLKKDIALMRICRFHRNVRAGVMMIFSLALAGCVVTSTYIVTSEPSGASVTVNGNYIGSTPVEFTFYDPVNAKMVLKKEGYDSVTSPIKTLLSARDRKHYVLPKAAPPGFVKTMNPLPATVEIRKGLEEEAWSAIIELLDKRFNLRASPEYKGYFRSSWIDTWTGEKRDDYRVRITVKLTQQGTLVEMISEASFRSERGWIKGTDEALLETLKKEISATVGKIN